MVGELVSRVLDKIPKGPAGYVGEGTTAGMVGDLVRDTMEAYLPTAPTDVEIAEVSPAEGDAKRYIVNVTGIVEKVSEMRAVFEALPGKLNLATDEVVVEDVEVFNDRPFRKTYQVTLKVIPKVDFPTKAGV